MRPRKLYSAKEAGEYSNLSSAMIRHYTRKGLLKGQYKGNGWLYTKPELDSFLKKIGR